MPKELSPLMEKVENVKPPTYDSTKSYQWAPDEVFNISGKELEYLYKVNSQFLQLPASQEVLKALEVHKILEQKIKEGVENETIVENK